MTHRNVLSRRAFLHALGGISGAAVLLAACGNTPPPGGAAAAATAAPAAAAAPTAAIPPTPVPTPVPERAATSGRANVITIWYPYTDPNWEQIWKAFEDSHLGSGDEYDYPPGPKTSVHGADHAESERLTVVAGAWHGT